MKNILVTGASGYLGAQFCQYFAEKGHRVTALCRSVPPFCRQWRASVAAVIVGDVRDAKTLSLLAQNEFDTIVHAISLDHHKSECHPGFVSSVSVTPTWLLLDMFSKRGLDTFAYFSTFQVYGKVPSEVISEDFMATPRNAYGLTHLLSENICNYYNQNTDVKCLNLRLTNSYGSPVFEENNCWWLVINDLCQTAFKEKKITLLSDGSPQRDFIHGLDVCRAVEVLLNSEKKNMQGNTFNVASGETLTIWELAQAVQRTYRKRYNDDVPILLPDGVSAHAAEEASRKRKYVVDNRRLSEMGFNRVIDLETGLNKVFSYLEQNNSCQARLAM